jgi:hypothetical protein
MSMTKGRTGGSLQGVVGLGTVGLLTLLGGSGCETEPPTDLAANGESVESSRQELIGVPAWGGPGGSYFETVYGNYWATDNRCGWYVDQMNLEYDFGTVATRQWVGPYGGWGGNRQGYYGCFNVDEYFVGIYGQYTPGQVANQLGFICGTVDRNQATHDVQPCGSSSGTNSFRYVCPRGDVVIKVAGRSGAWLDQIQILCGAPVTPPIY